MQSRWLNISRTFFRTSVFKQSLLATEAPITIPLLGVEGGASIDEVYLEFEDESGSLHELHEVSMGETYELSCRKKGGLCRYKMGDRVRVVGKHHRTPTIEFVGQGNRFSDLQERSLMRLSFMT